MIKYIKGDATNPIIRDNKVIIIHVCNNLGVWGKGFVMALSSKWPILRQKYMQMDKTMGNIEIVSVSNKVLVANMVAQNGINYANRKFKRRVDYDVLKTCLKQINEYVIKNNIDVYMPRIGSGLAGGNWTVIEQVIIDAFDDSVNITVYDL